MPKWSVGSDTGGQLQLVFVSKEDMLQFIETVIKPNAAAFGLEVTVRDAAPQKRRKGIEVVRI
jgi:hypothetical protein